MNETLGLFPPEEVMLPDRPSLRIEVTGHPMPQGSKTAFRNKTTGKLMVVDQSAGALHSWRGAITVEAYAARDHQLAGGWFGEQPVEVIIHFRLNRPVGQWSQNRKTLTMMPKPSAPSRPTTRPDVDKLTRGVLDALTDAKVFADDSQVVTITAYKWFANYGEPEGATIIVKEA